MTEVISRDTAVIPIEVVQSHRELGSQILSGVICGGNVH